MSIEFSDPAWIRPETLADIEREAPWTGATCDECGKGIRAGAHSMHFGNGVYWQNCDPCYRVRQRHGWTLDPRSLRELQREREKSA